MADLNAQVRAWLLQEAGVRIHGTTRKAPCVVCPGASPPPLQLPRLQTTPKQAILRPLADVRSSPCDWLHTPENPGSISRKVTTPTVLQIRPPLSTEYDTWLRLWDGYNAFYGRVDETALPVEVTRKTWSRFFNDCDRVHALVAEFDGSVVGLAHYLYHPSTTQIEGRCYLQDLFTDESYRGKGIGRALIEGVFEQARRSGVPRVYWQTHTSNAAGRRLYDQMASHSGFIVYSTELFRVP